MLGSKQDGTLETIRKADDEMIYKLDKFTHRKIDEFETIREAADDAGKSYQSMDQHVRFKRLYPERWYYRDSIDPEESFEKNSYRPVLAVIAGETMLFSCLTVMARTLGTQTNNLQNAFRGGHTKTQRGTITKIQYIN